MSAVHGEFKRGKAPLEYSIFPLSSIFIKVVGWAGIQQKIYSSLGYGEGEGD